VRLTVSRHSPTPSRRSSRRVPSPRNEGVAPRTLRSWAGASTFAKAPADRSVPALSGYH
jgi:hypothetical protein